MFSYQILTASLLSNVFWYILIYFWKVLNRQMIFFIVVQSLSHVQLFATPRTTACQTARGISQARILEWVVISFSRGCSQPRDWTHISCIGRRILYNWATREAPRFVVTRFQSIQSGWHSCSTVSFSIAEPAVFPFPCRNLSSACLLFPSIWPGGLRSKSHILLIFLCFTKCLSERVSTFFEWKNLR